MSPLLEREGENHVLPLKSAVTPGIVQDFLFGEGIDLKENSLHRLMFGDFVSSWWHYLGSIWKCDFAGERCHWRQALTFQKPRLSSLLVDQMQAVSSCSNTMAACSLPCSHHDGKDIKPLKLRAPNKHSLSAWVRASLAILEKYLRHWGLKGTGERSLPFSFHLIFFKWIFYLHVLLALWCFRRITEKKPQALCMPGH